MTDLQGLRSWIYSTSQTYGFQKLVAQKPFHQLRIFKLGCQETICTKCSTGLVEFCSSGSMSLVATLELEKKRFKSLQTLWFGKEICNLKIKDLNVKKVNRNESDPRGGTQAFTYTCVFCLLSIFCMNKFPVFNFHSWAVQWYCCTQRESGIAERLNGGRLTTIEYIPFDYSSHHCLLSYRFLVLAFFVFIFLLIKKPKAIWKLTRARPLCVIGRIVSGSKNLGHNFYRPVRSVVVPDPAQSEPVSPDINHKSWHISNIVPRGQCFS